MHVIPCLFALIGLGAASLTPSESIPALKTNNRLMFDYNWPEPDSKIKKYPHEKYCNYYYNIESEPEQLYTVRKCPRGKIFDYHVHECKDKKSAQCWSQRYGKAKVHDYIHSKWRKHFRCPFSSGKYPDIFHCKKYFLCSEGKAKHEHCPGNTKFDTIQRQCIEESLAHCANSTDLDDMSHKCPKHSGNIAHPRDCSKYYYCNKSKPLLQKCGNDNLYDEVDNVCKNKDKVQCGPRHNPYNKDEQILKELKQTNELIMQDTKSTSVRFSHDTESATVPVAHTTESTTESSTLITDGHITKCFSANGRQPYLFDNSRFIQCDNFEVHIKSCPHNQLFDSEQSACIVPPPS